MRTWTRVADDVFAAVHRQCYAGLDAATLHRRAIAQLRRAVPFEGYCAHDIDPVSRLPIEQYLDPPDDQQRRTFLEQVAALDAASRTSRYREVLAAQGFRFDLRCVYALDGLPWGGISAFREHGSPDFADREAVLVRRLAPHLAAGLRAAMLRAAEPQNSIAPNGPGVIVLDRRGRVTQHTPAAEYWLRQLAPLPETWREGDGLPTVVWVALAKLYKGLRLETTADSAIVPYVRARTQRGAWVQLQAALGEARDGQVGDRIIVIEALAPREVAWLRLSAYDLTPRERDIVELVVQGASTKQITEALYITEYTAQDHLKHIFDKTGVRSRRELVQQLFLDGMSQQPHA